MEKELDKLRNELWEKLLSLNRDELISVSNVISLLKNSNIPKEYKKFKLCDN
jgi:hypothetical protein